MVAGDDVFEPRNVERLERAGKRDGVFDRPAWPAVQGNADFVAEDLLHGFDARDDLCEAAFGEQAAVRAGGPARGSSYQAPGVARIVAGL